MLEKQLILGDIKSALATLTQVKTRIQTVSKRLASPLDADGRKQTTKEMAAVQKLLAQTLDQLASLEEHIQKEEG